MAQGREALGRTLTRPWPCCANHAACNGCSVAVPETEKEETATETQRLQDYLTYGLGIEEGVEELPESSNPRWTSLMNAESLGADGHRKTFHKRPPVSYGLVVASGKQSGPGEEALRRTLGETRA